MMNSCKKCRSHAFEAVCSTRIDLDLNKGVLSATGEEYLGDNGVYACANCGDEYERKDFVEIII